MTDDDQIRLLVVNDHSGFTDLVQDTVEINDYRFNIRCQVVDTGEEALEKIDDWAPEVVLIDAHIPDLNCMKILDEVDAESRAFIVTSTYNSPEIRDSVLAKGAYGYFPIEEDVEGLERLLEFILAISQSDYSTH